MRIKRILALLLALLMVMPIGAMQVQADPAPQTHSVTFTIIDPTSEEPIEGVIIEVDGASVVDTDSAGIAVINVIGTEKVRLAKEGYYIINVASSDLAHSEITVPMMRRPEGPRLAHTVLDISDMDNLILSATPLDGAIHDIRVKVFYKNSNGTVFPLLLGIPLTDMGDGSYTLNISEEVNEKIQNADAVELIYYFTMSDADGAFLKYPTAVNTGSLEGAITVNLVDSQGGSETPSVVHTPPTVTSLDSIPATFTITGLKEGDIPSINVYYKSALIGDQLSVVRQLSALTHEGGDTYSYDLADHEYVSMQAHTIEYYVSIMRGAEWFYYPKNVDPIAKTGLYSTPIALSSTLSGLSVTAGAFVRNESGVIPALIQGTVPNAVNSVSISATTKDSTDLLTIIPQPSTQGMPAVLPLSVGLNTITIHVQESGKSWTTYTIKITREDVSVPQPDKTALTNKINEASNLLNNASIGTAPGEYPLSAYNDFQMAVAAAAGVRDTAGVTQAALDSAYQALVTAMQAFEAAKTPEADKTALRAIIAEAEAFLAASVEGTQVGQYPAESKELLQIFLDSAKGTGGYAHATQGVVDQETNNLTSSLATFKAAVIKAGNSTTLQNKIAEATTLLNNSSVGTGVGQYPAAAKAALQTAVTAAEAFTQGTSTQAEINTAYQALLTAIQTFEATQVQPVDKAALQAAIAEATTFLNASEIGYTVGKYPQGAKNILLYIINAASILEQDANASQADINEAVTEVNAALATFKESIFTANPVTRNVLIAALNWKTHEQLSNVTLKVNGVSYTIVSAAGIYVDIIDGPNDIELSKDGYVTAVVNAYTIPSNWPGAGFYMNNIVTGTMTVKDKATKQAIQGVTIVVNGEAYTTDENGEVSVTTGEGYNEITISKPGYKLVKESEYHLDADNKYDFELVKLNIENLMTQIADATEAFQQAEEGTGVGEYPKAAIDALEAAIEAAEKVRDTATSQEAINNANAALQAAIAAFDSQKIHADLPETLTEAAALLEDSSEGTEIGQYPPGAKTALEAAIAEAEEIMNASPSQEEIDDAYKVLAAAIKTFKAAQIKKGDTQALENKITEVTTLLDNSPEGTGVGQYPPAAKAALQAAIIAAETAMEDTTATEKDIEAALQALAAAITVFENAKIPAGDSEVLENKITEVITLLGNSSEGTGVGQYPAAAKAALQTAIDTADNLAKNEATQAELDAAFQALSAAIAAFQASQIQAGNSTAIETKVSEITQFLNNSQEGSGVGQYPAGSKAILQTAIAAAQNVISSPATQAQLDSAYAQLAAAYDSFKGSVIKPSPREDNDNGASGGAQPQPVVQPPMKITDGMNTVKTGEGTVKTTTNEVQKIMEASRPVILESTIATIDFGTKGLNVPELKQNLSASLELGAQVTEKAKTDQVLAGAKLSTAGLAPLGGKVLDLIAQLNYSDGTKTKIKSFAEPVKVTINLKELGLTGDKTNLTAVRFVPQEDGTYKTIKLGGVYIPATDRFEFYTDSFSLYSIVKADQITKITFTIDSTKYSVGQLAKQTDVPPVVQNQRTLVPIRVVAEALGAKVDWNNDTQTVTITLNGKVLTMTLGKTIEGMDVAAQAMNGRTMVPLRYVSEALGAYVMWFGEDQRIEIIK